MASSFTEKEEGEISDFFDQEGEKTNDTGNVGIVDGILEHDRKRNIELKCAEYEAFLRKQGFENEQTIKYEVDQYRVGIDYRNMKLKEAFGISKNVVVHSKLREAASSKTPTTSFNEPSNSNGIPDPITISSFNTPKSICGNVTKDSEKDVDKPKSRTNLLHKYRSSFQAPLKKPLLLNKNSQGSIELQVEEKTNDAGDIEILDEIKIKNHSRNYRSRNYSTSSIESSFESKSTKRHCDQTVTQCMLEISETLNHFAFLLPWEIENLRKIVVSHFFGPSFRNVRQKSV